MQVDDEVVGGNIVQFGAGLPVAGVVQRFGGLISGLCSAVRTKQELIGELLSRACISTL